MIDVCVAIFQVGILLVFEISVTEPGFDIINVLYSEAAVSILHIRSSSSVLAPPKQPRQLGDH